MHLATYTKADAGKMLAHYDRSIGGRAHIDPEGRVYNLAPEHPGGCRARFAEMCEGIEIGAKTRPLADFLVTKPEGFAGDVESLFKAAYDELVARVGEERIVSAYVHLDEPGAQPHMHFSFVPIVESPVMTNDKSQPLLWTKKDERKNPAHKAGTQKVDGKGTPRYKRVPLVGDDGEPVMRRTATASKMFTKEEMRDLHPMMEAALCDRLGVERVGITLDPDDAKRQLSSLKHDEYERVTAEIERAKAEAAELEQRLERLRCGREDAELRIEQLEEAIAVERDRVAAENYAKEALNGGSRTWEIEDESRAFERQATSAGSRGDAVEARVEQLRSRVNELRKAIDDARRGMLERVPQRLREQALKTIERMKGSAARLEALTHQHEQVGTISRGRAR